MEFVKVRHEDGREADITPEEVASYQEMGFKQVKESADGETVELREPAKTDAATTTAAPAKPSGKTG